MANVLELYDRFKGGGRGGKMVYPLENQADYLGKMTFTPIIETKVDMAEQTGNLKDLAIDAVKIGFDATKALFTEKKLPDTYEDYNEKTLQAYEYVARVK